MGGVLRSAMGLVKTATGGGGSKAEQLAKATRTSPADVVRINVVFFLVFFKISVCLFFRFLGVDVKILRRVLIQKKPVVLLVQ